MAIVWTAAQRQPSVFRSVEGDKYPGVAFKRGLPLLGQAWKELDRGLDRYPWCPHRNVDFDGDLAKALLLYRMRPNNDSNYASAEQNRALAVEMATRAAKELPVLEGTGDA